MRKILKNIIIFIFGIVSLDVLCGYILDALYNNAKYGNIASLRYIMHESDDDVIVLGSSTAHHNYVPSIIRDSLNFKSYNGGIDGNCIYYHYSIVSSLIESGHKPNVILYDISELDLRKSILPTFTIESALSILSPLYKDVSEVDSLVKYKGFLEEIKMQSSLYRYNSKLFNLASCLVINKHNTDGFEPLYGKLDLNKLGRPKMLKTYNDNLKEYYVNKLIDLAKKNNIKLVFVKSPHYVDTECKEYKEKLLKIVKMNNIPLIDMNKEAKLMNLSNFKDYNHLNYDGAVLFTQLLCGHLKSILKN